MKAFQLILGLLLLSVFIVYLSTFDETNLLLNTILSVGGVFCFIYSIIEIIKKYK
jgi:hypothetical protein